MTAINFATWNINLMGGRNATPRKVDFLMAQAWDVLALQEVTPEAAELFAQAGFEQWIFPKGVEKHGVALASRHGVRLVAPALMEALPNPHRGLWALAVLGSDTVEVGSLHITNATNGKSKIKRQHYVELEAWLQRPVVARVLGMDANHAFDPRWPDLPDAAYEPRNDDWDREYAFFSGDNQHGFKDVWFEQLQRDPAALARATTDAKTRPSAFSYAKRVRAGTLIEDRMDYIFASGMKVGKVVYDQAGRGPGLSDHALVTAELFCGATADSSQ